MVNKSNETPKLEDILVEDDASKYLASLSDEERRPKETGLGGLPKENGKHITPEERNLLRDIWRKAR